MILFLIQIIIVCLAILTNKKFADVMCDKLIETDKSDWWSMLFIGFSLNGVFIVSLMLIACLIEEFSMPK